MAVKVKSAMAIYQKINVIRSTICVESFMLLWRSARFLGSAAILLHWKWNQEICSYDCHSKSSFLFLPSGKQYFAAMVIHHYCQLQSRVGISWCISIPKSMLQNLGQHKIQSGFKNIPSVKLVSSSILLTNIPFGVHTTKSQ